MKKAMVIALSWVAIAASAQVQVDGHIRRDGTYVAPSYRTAPNNTLTDNYSSKPNVNPYTGQAGTVDPYKQPSYQAPARPYGGGYVQPKNPWQN